MKLVSGAGVRPAVIGLGYVGLPLAVEMAKRYDVIGFDIDDIRINELINNFDSTNEVTSEKLSEIQSKIDIKCSELANRNIYIVTVLPRLIVQKILIFLL